MSETWSHLPYLALVEVFDNLSYKDVLRAGQVCHAWHQASRDEHVWRRLFVRHFSVDSSTTLPIRGRTWAGEFKRLCFHTPLFQTETLQDHVHQVLHVSFSHNGKYFATCSKDGTVLVWNSKYPASVQHSKDMKSFAWKYTQFSQFNQSDTLLLVSGVHFGTPHSTSGEIAVFNLAAGFELQCRVANKPYDIFGTWYNDRLLFSGEMRWLSHLASSSSLWLNKASQESESERVPVTHKLFRFYNRNASSIRSIMVANCLRTDQSEDDLLDNCEESGVASNAQNINREIDCTSPGVLRPNGNVIDDPYRINLPLRRGSWDPDGLANVMGHGNPLSYRDLCLDLRTPMFMGRNSRNDRGRPKRYVKCFLSMDEPLRPNTDYRKIEFQIETFYKEMFEDDEAHRNGWASATLSSDDEDTPIQEHNNVASVGLSNDNQQPQQEEVEHKKEDDDENDADGEQSSREDEATLSEEDPMQDKYLIFTTGYKTFTPHQIGVKRIKAFQFPKHLDPGPSIRERLELQERMRQESRARPLAEAPDWMDFDAVAHKFDQIDHLFDLDGHIVGMGLSPDHRFLYVNSRSWPRDYKITSPVDPPPIAQEIDIHVIDLVAMKEVGTLLRSHKAFTPNHDCFFIFLDVSNEYVASGAEDKHGYLWDRHYGMCLMKYPHRDVVNSVAFNPADPEMLVTVSDDTSIKIWRSRSKVRELSLGNERHFERGVDMCERRSTASHSARSHCAGKSNAPRDNCPFRHFTPSLKSLNRSPDMPR